jgi:hypothetical protein
MASIDTDSVASIAEGRASSKHRTFAVGAALKQIPVTNPEALGRDDAAIGRSKKAFP